MQRATSITELMVLAREMYQLPVGKEREQMYMVYASAVERRWGRYQTSAYEKNKQNVARQVALKRMERDRANAGSGTTTDQ